MTECCMTVNMTCWSLPKSTSDMEAKEKGETKKDVHTQ